MHAVRLLATLLAVAWMSLTVSAYKRNLNATAIYGSEANAQYCYGVIYQTAYDRIGGGDLGPLVRLTFHDAGTYDATDPGDNGGGDGSVGYELSFPQQGGGVPDGLKKARDILSRVKGNSKCKMATLADVIQIAGAAAIYKSGGPACPLWVGRPDATTADYHVTNLPSPCADAYTDNANVESLLTVFSRMGFSDPIKAFVVLSGSHSLGKQQGDQPPACTKGRGDMTNNNNRFDGHYYHEVIYGSGKAGWFSSDMTLATAIKPASVNYTSDAVALATEYANQYKRGDVSGFFKDWCYFYQEMSLLGLITTKDIHAGYAVPRLK